MMVPQHVVARALAKLVLQRVRATNQLAGRRGGVDSGAAPRRVVVIPA
ncbi:MAG: hypothetical protein ACRDQA_03180 [Nocardioidaceae bacterium]